MESTKRLSEPATRFGVCCCHDAFACIVRVSRFRRETTLPKSAFFDRT